MNEFETLTLPVSGREVLIRGYMNGLIDREVKKIQAGAAKMRYETDASAVDNVAELDTNSFPPGTKVILEPDPTATMDADDKLLELMVSSLDGNTGDVFNRLMQLPAKDVAFVMSKVKEIQAASEVTAADPKAPTS